ncbi:hypothetical protein VNO78_33546 [Psophocarpus tetragonolobus]|uniref:Uncharacterized protein n=1 Tax=Psophocarpus tetragonolobus TaxID=3891 RepID=A0AAN9P1C0_PSOTE
MQFWAFCYKLVDSQSSSILGLQLIYVFLQLCISQCYQISAMVPQWQNGVAVFSQTTLICFVLFYCVFFLLNMLCRD